MHTNLIVDLYNIKQRMCIYKGAYLFLEEKIVQIDNYIEHGGDLNEIFGKKVRNAHRYTMAQNKDGAWILSSKVSVLENGEYRFCNFEEFEDKFSNLKVSKLLIIMESPHESEYVDGKPVTLANGQTGMRIKANLDYLFIKMQSLGVIDQRKYHVCLINPVPYQASLGIETSLFRDIVWRFLWDHHPDELQDKFENLIKSLPQGSIILNCCTRNLKGKITEVLKKEAPSLKKKKVISWKLGHPSSWNKKSFDTLKL